MPNKNLNRKILLRDLLLAALDENCAMLDLTVCAAVDAATNTESKPENKYDTRALEASYLAGAQRERLNEAKGMRRVLASTELRSFDECTPIASTAVVELECDGIHSSCFLLPFAAGFSLPQDSTTTVHTVSLQSPLGQGLVGKFIGDSFTISIAGKDKIYEIIFCY